MKLGVIFAAVLAAAAALLFAERVHTNNMLTDLRNGEARLVCDLGAGLEEIEADRIQGYLDGLWLFDNGHAKSCEVQQ